MIKPISSRSFILLCLVWVLQGAFSLCLNAQTVIGGDTVDVSAVLDIQDTARGVLLPRLTMAQRNAIVKPAAGLIILNTTRKCLETNIGSPDVPDWKCLTTGVQIISEADTLYWNKKLGAGDTASLSARINTKLTAADTVSLSNRINGKLSPQDTLSLSNRIDAKLSSFSESDPVFNTSIAKGITAADTSYWNSKTGLPPSGNNPGNILYWNGTSWVRLNPGLPGQGLVLSQEGLPVWAGAAYATVMTNAPGSITPTSATVGGNISADGGANVSARGIVWGTTPNPTLSASVLNLGSGTGSFSGTLSGLAPNTLYYVRAYATNSAGTAYGNQESFSTLEAAVPVLSTNSIVSITQTRAISGGKITNDGGAPVTQRGIVYGTAQNPTLANAFTQDGSGTGNFTSTLSGLASNTTYYVRAYATNSAGTAYGNELSFIFNPPVYTCGANVAPGVWKQFMCHNLGAANPAADPSTPSWEINGGYWQWGTKEMAALGPSGPGPEQANDGAIAGWNTTAAPSGSWSDAVKTSNDPCPTGYRVPTRAQWQGVIENNTKTIIGSSWTDSATNYSTGILIGVSLFLPAASHINTFGELLLRGNRGYYYSSSDPRGFPETLFFNNSQLNIQEFSSINAFSVRCIAE